MKKMLLLLIASTSISLMGMENNKQITPLGIPPVNPEITPGMLCCSLGCACCACLVKTAYKIACCPFKECFNIGKDCVYCFGTRNESQPGVMIVHPDVFK